MIKRFDIWKKHNVTNVKDVSEFLDTYYKPDRYKGRGAEYATYLLASKEKDFLDDGVTIISHHDSVTGLVVAFYGDNLSCKDTTLRDLLKDAYKLGYEDGYNSNNLDKVDETWKRKKYYFEDYPNIKIIQENKS